MPDFESTPFAWTAFYQEFADKLLPFKNNRIVLLKKLDAVYARANIKMPMLEQNINGASQPFDDIDPFTVFGLFNRDTSANNIERAVILPELAKEFKITAPVPYSFEGLTPFQEVQAVLFPPQASRDENVINHLWELFEYGLKYADSPNDHSKSSLIGAYDAAMKQLYIGFNLSIGLSCSRPFTFLGLDPINRKYIVNPAFIDQQILSQLNGVNFNHPHDCIDGAAYFHTIETFQNSFNHPQNLALLKARSFPELSYQAHLNSPQPNTFITNPNYWLFAPGEQAYMWEDFLDNEIMAMGWDVLGDLNQYADYNALHATIDKLKAAKDPECTQSAGHITSTCLSFRNDIKVGDVVFAKQGESFIIGRGIVQSGYIFDTTRFGYRHVYKIKWTHKCHYEFGLKGYRSTLQHLYNHPQLIAALNQLFK